MAPPIHAIPQALNSIPITKIRPSVAALPQALHSIAITKIRELQKQRNRFAGRTKSILDQSKEVPGLRARTAHLHKSLEKLGQWNDNEFHNLKRWIAQAEYDPSVSDEKVETHQTQLLQRLEIENRKLDLADLYSRLITEWMEHNQGGEINSNLSQLSTEDAGSYGMIQSAHKERLDQLRDKFARVVFEPLHTDEAEINSYLSKMFDGEEAQKVLARLKHQVSTCDTNLDLDTVDRSTLTWTIKALQKDNMLSEDKRATLDEFLLNEAVLDEIQDVLNLRIKDIDNWEWDLDGAGIPIVPRRSVNGTWRIMVDEDIIQAILTHFIGTSWSVKIKKTLQNLIIEKSVWKHSEDRSRGEKDIRSFFDPSSTYDTGPQSARFETYKEDFFLTPLPSTQHEAANIYDNDDDSPAGKKSGREMQQKLLRTIATEVLFRQAFDGEVAVIQSDFQWFATGISLDTIFSILRFVGFNERSMKFVRKVLEPPLDMLDGSPVRIRKRGLPMSHIFEKVFGELVLFFLDLAANQKAGQILYRFHDDLWVVGKPAQCAMAWTTIQEFAKVMGLELNNSKTGSVYWSKKPELKNSAVARALPEGSVHMDFLVLNPDSGKWDIDQTHVAKHIEHLGRRLVETKSILEWIKTWNSCIGYFFAHTFGEPGQCFGRPHLDAILQTHQDIQRSLFDGKVGSADSVTVHLKQMMSSRFSVPATLVPDAFIFLPSTLGGLGLSNPFISLLLARGDIVTSPEARLEEYLENERKAYQQAKVAFEALTERERRARWRRTFEGDSSERLGGAPPILSWSEAQTFPTLEEYTRYRELDSADLKDLYTKFMQTPEKNDINLTEKTKIAAEALANSGLSEYELMDNKELLWLLEYYHDDLIRDFGELRCIPRDLFPFGVLGAMDKKKAIWHMVI